MGSRTRTASFVPAAPAAAPPSGVELQRSGFFRGDCALAVRARRARPVRNRRPKAAAAPAAAADAAVFTAPSAELASEERKKVVVVGAGWAGLAAAYELSKRRDVDVTLVEAGSSLGGLASGWRTAQGRSVEAGVHGFWRQYNNIFRIVDELGIEPFTDPVEQAFYGLERLEAVWPVFGKLPKLPAPLGSFQYVKYETVPLVDRLSAWGAIGPLADFDNSNEAWSRYDKISARDLFRACGVSRRLYEEVLNPMLLFGLFAPGEECSAAAALSMSLFFILGQHDAFDARYARGPVSEVIFRPLREAIEARGGRLCSGTRVADVLLGPGGAAVGLACEGAFEGVLECDAVVFAVGVSAMQRIVAGSAALRGRPDFRAVSDLRAVDCLATRLWLEGGGPLPHAANACRHPDPSTGFTVFDVGQLHDEYRGSSSSGGSETVLEVDYYHSAQLLALDDEAAAAHSLENVRRIFPHLRPARLLDSAVVRLPRAVTHFYPGAHQHLLRERTSIPNVFAAGDWVRGGARMEDAWSQEKAAATGLRAAAAALDALGLPGPWPRPLPLDDPEPHILAARAAAARLRAALPVPLPPDFLF
eukprot:tig00000655_g2872.t1